MKFISTRNPSLRVNFEEALFQGLASDGGLFIPEEDLHLQQHFRAMDRKTSFQDIASLIAAYLMKGEIDAGGIQRIVRAAFPFEPKLVQMENGLSILELFHGPSSAFKDFGASFLAATMEEYLQNSARRAVILTATSGDTGSAVAQAFHNRRNVDVVILYPSGRVSPLQEKQLTTLGGNVLALEVKGSFDDCQRLVKEAFVDPVLKKALPLTSANSISLGRLIPQSFYYVWAFAQLKDRLEEELFFCVPSGNFGNLTAGVYAWKWGLPVTGFVAATNANDVVPQYLETGIYQPRPSVLTYSNAMDVGSPSNFERLEAVFQKNWNLMRAMIFGQTVTDAETLSTIREVYQDHNMFLCPHTAVGYQAAQRFREENRLDHAQLCVLATAHPAKFLDIVERATGKTPELPPGLAAAATKAKQAILVEPQLETISRLLLERLA
ncbi:MAG: threonine synthase [Spirochaetales bacterium]|nr:threonine synthase [Spirochaetales bacterium]